MTAILNFLYQHPYLFALLTACLGAAFMPTVIRVAREKNFVVKPNKRTSHVGLVPAVGGLDIFISFFIFFVVFVFNRMPASHYLLVGVTLILIVGFVDDLIDLSVLGKLFGETIAAVFLIFFANERMTSLFGMFGIGNLSLAWSYIFSLATYIVITNALNLIDGIDGLASGLGMLYCLLFAIYFQLVGDLNMAMLGYALLGALAVFFCFNVFGGSRRKVFMGDAGSLLLGFMVSWFVFRFMQLNADPTTPACLQFKAAPAVAFCILFVPLFDTLRVMLTRIKKHRSPFTADRNHIHHLLLSLGLQHKQVTLVLFCASLVFCALAFVGRNWRNEWLLLVAFALGTALTLIVWRLVDKHKKQEIIDN
jgi:UDP-GlcNAc:undecaprenyl-phosphate/decaprenyl-phosphate GlcNAc-1-phosphate transferase